MGSSSVGTRGGVEWMKGPCACPRRNATMLLHGTPGESSFNEDKRKAPTLPRVHPLSLQNGATLILVFDRQITSGRCEDIC